jgi:hypothetical protein
LKPAPQHQIIEGKVSYSKTEAQCAPKHPLVPTVLSQAQIETEHYVTQAVFQVQFQQPHEPYYEVSATAFQIAPDTVMTNRHVLEQLLGTHFNSHHDLQGQAEKYLNAMEFHSSIPGLTFQPEKLLYCSSVTDFCIIKLAPLKNGSSAGKLLPSLKFSDSRALQKNSKLNPTVVGIVGNMNGEGLQVATDRLIRIQNTGLLLHCVPTSPHESGGNSGSPIFDQNGEVIGIDTYSLALDSGCRNRLQTTGGGIASDTLLNDLKQNQPDLYQAINPN